MTFDSTFVGNGVYDISQKIQNIYVFQNTIDI